MSVRKIISTAFFVLLIVCSSFYQAGAQDADTDKKLSDQELEQLLAPVALYPDELLSQVLVASTYPLEVVEADRWAQSHKDLKGDDLKAELDKQTWDESVKGLTQTPDVLATMSKNLDWTQKLGDAVLAQQDDVMKASQRLRSKAYTENKLQSNDQQKVEVNQSGDQQTIIIQSATPGTVYVPYYEPTVVYGTWAYPAYPPYYYPPPPGYAVASGLAAGIAFGVGVAIADDIWDHGFDWGHNDIDIDINNNFNKDVNINNINRPGKNGGGTQWKHNPEHRKGVGYSNDNLNKKFTPQRAAANRDTEQIRQQFRGRTTDNAGLPQHKGIDTSLRDRDIEAAHRNTAAARDNLSGATRHTSANLPQRDRSDAFSNINSGRQTQLDSARGRSSLGAGSGFSRPASGGVRPGGGLGGGGARLHR